MLSSSTLLPTCLWLLAAALAADLAHAQQAGYTIPSTSGGSSLTVVNNTYPAGLGEPLNIIVTGLSDASVLEDSLDGGGFQNWALSLQFGAECGSVSVNDKSGVGHQANLGDGQSLQEEIATLRQNFGDTSFGTCLETLNGGGHFRYYQQGGSNAFFLEASVEMSLSKQHDIVPNGYNLGRDQVIGVACSNTTIPTTALVNGSSFSGQSAYNGWTYQNDVVYVSGLLANSSDGVNHASTVELDGRPAIDGLTAVVTVSVSQQGSATAGGGGDSVPATTSVSDFSGAPGPVVARPAVLVAAAAVLAAVAAGGLCIV